MMIIRDKAIEPYFIESDYNGLTLKEPGKEGKNDKILIKAPIDGLMTLLGDVVKRKMAAMDGNVSLEEYINRSTALEQSIKDALGLPKNAPQQERLR